MTRKFPTRAKAAAERDIIVNNNNSNTTPHNVVGSVVVAGVRRSRALNFPELEVDSISVASPVIRFDEIALPSSPFSPLLRQQQIQQQQQQQLQNTPIYHNKEVGIGSGTDRGAQDRERERERVGSDHCPSIASSAPPSARGTTTAKVLLHSPPRLQQLPFPEGGLMLSPHTSSCNNNNKMLMEQWPSPTKFSRFASTALGSSLMTVSDSSPSSFSSSSSSSSSASSSCSEDDDVLTFHDVEKQFERQILDQDLTLRFTIQYRCLPGQCIRVVGSADPLGNWNVQFAPSMTWLPGDEWTLELTFPLTPRPILERGDAPSPNKSSPLLSSPTKSALDGSTVLAHFEYKYCVTTSSSSPSGPVREFQILRWENGLNRSFTITKKRAEGTRHFKLPDSWQE